MPFGKYIKAANLVEKVNAFLVSKFNNLEEINKEASFKNKHRSSLFLFNTNIYKQCVAKNYDSKSLFFRKSFLILMR